MQSFTPGTRDISRNFSISKKLYGRETELSRLIISFYKAAKGYKENIFIKGEPGIGKTKLILEFKQNVTEAGGILLSGKFSKKDRQKPYTAFQQAFSQFLRDIISRGESATNLLKKQFETNLKYNAKILSDLIPEIEIFTGHQTENVEVSPIRNKNRFFTACKQFLESCLSFAKPVVFFLDDLHWADPASLELFSLISKYFQGGPLLVIGAYRDIDNPSTQYISKIINSLREDYISFEIIELNSLATHHIAELVQDSFGNDPGENVSFANLVFQQTGGNPFQIHQYIFSMHASKLIFYDYDTGIWRWDFDTIYRKSRQNFSENYIKEILNEFPIETTNLLKVATCWGTKFSASKLSIVLEKPMRHIVEILKPAFISGLLFQVSSKTDDNDDTLYFRHDHIQQTIIDSMSQKEIRKNNLKIGKRLNSYYKNPDSETLYEIVYHLNEGAECLEPGEKYFIAELNVRAAKNAIKFSSGSTALIFLDNAKKLLGENKWHNAPELTTEIYLEAGYSALISGDHEKVQNNVIKIISSNDDQLSQVKAYELLISSQISDNRLEESIESGIYILEKLGIKIDKNTNSFKNYFHLKKTKFLLTKNPANKIAALPKIDDQVKKTIIRILSLLLTPAYFAFPRLQPVLSSLIVKLSISSGYSDETAYGLAAFSISLASELKNYEAAAKLGKTSIMLAKNDDNLKSYGRTLIVNALFLKHWNDPVNSCLPMLRKGKESTLQIGDFEYAAFGMESITIYSIFAGHPLINIKKELEITETSLEQMGQKLPLNHVRTINIFIKILLNESEIKPISETDLIRNREYKDESPLTLDKTSKFLINLGNTILFLLIGNIPLADKYWIRADANVDAASSVVSYPYHLFLGTLISILKFENNTKQVYSQQILDESQDRESRFVKILKKAPENHMHRYNLLKAERARLSGNFELAERYYQKTINLAREKDFTYDEAYAAERASIFFKQNKMTKTSYGYMNTALAAYRKWGCLIKLTKIISTETAQPKPNIRYFTDPEFPLRSFPKIFRGLRLLTEKSNENELILQLMDILIEVSGATHGYFINFKNNIPYVKASITADGGPEYYDPGASISSFTGIIEPVLNNVFKTSQIFYPEQISSEYSTYYTPEAEKVPKSVICLPVIRKQILKGLIYLENLDIKNVFTQDKIEILSIISAHTAVCLETVGTFYNLSETIGSKKQEENILQKTQLKLEQRIKQRTEDLIKLNKKLQKEIEFKVKAEKALIQSETKYKTLVERMSDGLGVQDTNGIITYVNERFCEIIGYRNTEIIGKKAVDILELLNVDQTELDFNKIDKHVVVEQTITTSEGKILNVLFQGQNLYDDEGNFEGSFGVITDITPLKEMAWAVQQREEQIRALLNATTDTVIMINPEGRILTANSSAAKRVGYSLPAFIGKNLFDIFSQDFLGNRQKHINQIVNTGKIVKFKDSSGGYVFDITLYPVMNNSGKIDRIAVYAKDITELKKAEEQISTLTKEIIKAQENERRKIALDLHDHVAQNLSFLKITADSMKNLSPEDFEERIDKISTGLKDSISDIRHISYDLRPPNLDELGLVKAIYQHCEEFSLKYDIDIDFGSAGISNLKLDFDIEINLFRIIQEALNNIHKHSEATNVRVRLIASYPRIIMRVEDNGKGFTYSNSTIPDISGEKMGLKGMLERVNLIGGKMEINTNPGFGTKIVAEIPYPEIKESDIYGEDSITIN